MSKMKLVVQIKFSSEKQKITKFGDFRYLVYLPFKKEEPGVMSKFLDLMSKEIGVPSHKIRYQGKQGDNHIFDVE
jgi:hypothetical protein